MFNLSEFVKNSTKPVYVRLADQQTAQRFLQDAEAQGFTFADGTKPTGRQAASFYAVHSDWTISYIGFVGRIAYQCNSDAIIRLNLAERITEDGT